MVNLIAAAAAFVGIHVCVAGTRLREVLVARLGEGPYRGLFSLLTLGTLGWFATAYRAVRVIAPPPEGAALVAVHAVMLCAVWLAAAGMLTPNATAVGGEGVLERGDGARGVHRITRHPFLWGVMLWALVHIACTRRPPDWLFFSAFLVLAALGQASIDRKRSRRLGERWGAYAQATSVLPFAAIVQGRNRLVVRELLDWRLAVSLAVYAGVVAVHPVLFGVSLW